VAKLLARDRVTRLALLRIEAADLPVARWAERETWRVGQWALAAGFGFGTSSPALTAGVLSGLDRQAGLALQTDAKISPGNYGGPLFDLDGRVLGICVPMGLGEDEIAAVDLYDSGIGFAVPREVIAPRIERLAAGQTLQRGLLGIQVDSRVPAVGGPWPDEPTPQDDHPPRPGLPLPPPAESRPAASSEADETPLPALDETIAGVRIEETPEEPARAAGLRRGDYVLSIDGLATPSRLSLRRVLARRAAGETVVVEVQSADGERRTVTVTLVSPPEAPPVPTP
jgi:serine protease Do